MANFESVTFGGSGLDRAAHIRTDKETLQKALVAPQSRAVIFWRGKPLVQDSDGVDLVRLPLAHPICAHAQEAPIFLGREGDLFLFAYDISSWQPADQDLPEDTFADQTQQQYPGLPEAQAFVELRSVMAELSARDAELAATARALFEWHRTHPFCSKCGAKTNVDQAGWQRRCPDCNGMHFPRTDPVVIMLITQGNNVLVGRSPFWPERMYSLLAGFLEPGETPEAAVRREVFEESGVRVGEVKYLGSQPWAFPSSLMLGYQGEALSTEISIDPVEIEDAFWISREEVMEVFAGNHAKMREPRNGAIAHFILKNWLEDCLE